MRDSSQKAPAWLMGQFTPFHERIETARLTISNNKIRTMNQSMRTLLRTWRNMTAASLILSALLILAAVATAMKPPWYAIWLVWLLVLSGPFSVLGFGHAELLPLMVLFVCLYGLSVAWLFWKPSVWSRWFFIAFSVLWLLFGWSIASIGM